MEQQHDSIRYRALALSETIEKQGRRRDWLAARAGISPGQLTRISNGSRTASHEVAEAIASALGLPLFLLFVPTEQSETATERVA
jgi:transcriptional regulator with XRE-family HTH domain